jgi:hypothetical protein
LERKETMSEKEKNKSHIQNALVHGLYAKDVLLPWDSKDDFEKLHTDLKVEFRPHGRAEEETVLDLAFLYWRKQTLWRMWQTAVLKDPFTLDILETERKSWTGIRKRLRLQARSERTVLGAADAKLAKMFSQIRTLQKEIDAASDQQEVKLIEEKITALVRIIHEHALPLVQALAQGPNAEKAFDSAYSTENIEKIVRLEASLDARISKVLARLVGLKEFKRTPAAAMPTTAFIGPP